MLLHPVSPHITPSKPGWVYLQAETGVDFQSGDLNALKERIRKHRKAMGLDLSHDWWKRTLHEICLQNQHVACQPNPEAEGFASPLVLAGRALWAELKDYIKNYSDPPTGDQILDAEAWVRNWGDRAPAFAGCRCREHWLKVVSARPPVFTSKQAFWAWAVEAHNDVNSILSKPRWVVSGDCEAEPIAS